MKLSTIQGRLGILFLAFFLLVAISVGATFWGTESQRQDARVINLAGRQRMLVQQMARLALEVEKEGRATYRQDLQTAATTFEQTLTALREGGAAPDSPGQIVFVSPTRDERLLAQLDQVDRLWNDFSQHLQVVLLAEPGGAQFHSAVNSLQQASAELAGQADAVVRSYEAAARQKMARLRWVQAGFFAGALVLLGLGAWWTRRSVLAPLQNLGIAARRIGEGDLQTPVQVKGSGEVEILANTFETARQQLLESRSELLALTDTLEARVTLRTHELEALYQVSKDISSRLDIQHVLGSVVERTRLLLGAEVAYLCLLDEDSKALNLQAASGPPEAVMRSTTSPSAPLVGQVLASECALPCGIDGCWGTCSMVIPTYQTSHLAAPLRTADRLLGALCVGSSQPQAFSKEAEGLLTRLASSAAVALENARLYTQAERLATLEERQRLAAEMHDGLAQTLNYIRLMAELVRLQIEAGQLDRAQDNLGRIQAASNQSESEVRQSIASLQETFPLYYTLQEQLASLAAQLSSDEGTITWETTVNVPLVLSNNETEQVLRVAREALLNACQHAQANNITLRLGQLTGHLRLTVEDDGTGFDLDRLSAVNISANGGANHQGDGGDDGRTDSRGDNRRHFGVKIMRARAARIGGELEISSVPGQGTRLTLTWPIYTENTPELHPIPTAVQLG